MNALSRMIAAVRPGGLILDLQVIRPNPKVELGGRVVGAIDGDPLFRWADAATAAVDARIEAGVLVEEAVDDHEVCKHFSDGAELVEDVAEAGHNVFGNGCAPRLMGRFIATANARDLDATCLQQLAAPPPILGAFGWDP